jgi:hypothetical protein
MTGAARSLIQVNGEPAGAGALTKGTLSLEVLVAAQEHMGGKRR